MTALFFVVATGFNAFANPTLEGPRFLSKMARESLLYAMNLSQRAEQGVRHLHRGLEAMIENEETFETRAKLNRIAFDLTRSVNMSLIQPIDVQIRDAEIHLLQVAAKALDQMLPPREPRAEQKILTQVEACVLAAYRSIAPDPLRQSAENLTALLKSIDEQDAGLVDNFPDEWTEVRDRILQAIAAPTLTKQRILLHEALEQTFLAQEKLESKHCETQLRSAP